MDYTNKEIADINIVENYNIIIDDKWTRTSNAHHCWEQNSVVRGRSRSENAYLPGTGDSVISNADPPGLDDHWHR